MWPGFVFLLLISCMNLNLCTSCRLNSSFHLSSTGLPYMFMPFCSLTEVSTTFLWTCTHIAASPWKIRLEDCNNTLTVSKRDYIYSISANLQKKSLVLYTCWPVWNQPWIVSLFLNNYITLKGYLDMDRSFWLYWNLFWCEIINSKKHVVSRCTGARPSSLICTSCRRT